MTMAKRNLLVDRAKARLFGAGQNTVLSREQVRRRLLFGDANPSGWPWSAAAVNPTASALADAADAAAEGDEPLTGRS